jgi:hypothetical protein
LTTDPQAYVQAEGELIGRTPIEVRLYPRTLSFAARNTIVVVKPPRPEGRASCLTAALRARGANRSKICSVCGNLSKPSGSISFLIRSIPPAARWRHNARNSTG